MAGSVFVGNVEVVPLLDAVLPNPVSEAAPDVEIEAVGHAYPELAAPDGILELPVTCYLVRSRGCTVLVDSGVGPRRRGSWPVGRLDVALADVGVLPTDIDIVVNSHHHVDHVGWNTVDDAAGEARPWFSAARYLVQGAEWSFWSTPDQLQRPGNAHLRECVAPLFGQADVTTVGSDDAITADLSFVPLPGHTPGHVGVGITSGSERAIILGDASHYLAQLDHTDWSPTWDHDRRLAARTRATLFDRLEREDALVVAGHWPYPGLGRLVRVGGRRIFVGVAVPEPRETTG